MEILEQNLPLLLSIFLMLLGAFLIGFYTGNVKSPSIKTTIRSHEKTIEVEQPLSIEKIHVDEIESYDRLEISDLVEPGQIRARKTRERAGKLSEEMKNGMASKYIDFSTLGHGDPSRPDNLKSIIGIGSFVEEKLNAIGIQNFSQLAQMTDDDIRAVTKVIEFFPGRIHRDDWKGQAKDLLENKK